MDDLIWTEPALQDLDDIGSYIALDSPRAAESVVRRKRRATDCGDGVGSCLPSEDGARWSCPLDTRV
ncbi:type II toxin-antitoxin system RelE/ParE family toxin, partial [Salmonella enterica subsp. enterica serovar Enteritidis]|nr:type II toxin-antitoxin system RelE/ParE family toxin [Salmonella enterica subsp. enterica serovar Enteritidis]